MGGVRRGSCGGGSWGSVVVCCGVQGGSVRGGIGGGLFGGGAGGGIWGK